MKMIAVMFMKTNARVLVNPGNWEELARSGTAIIDPDLTHVKTTPPHFWKMECGQVVPMNDAERAERLKNIEQCGVDNTVITKAVVSGDPLPNFAGMLDDAEKEIMRLKNANTLSIKVFEEKLKMKDKEIVDAKKATLLAEGSLKVVYDTLEMTEARVSKWIRVSFAVSLLLALTWLWGLRA